MDNLPCPRAGALCPVQPFAFLLRQDACRVTGTLVSPKAVGSGSFGTVLRLIHQLADFYGLS